MDKTVDREREKRREKNRGNRTGKNQEATELKLPPIHFITTVIKM